MGVNYLLHPLLRALIEPLPGGGLFHAIRHVIIGHGEPWLRHWDLVVDVQRELFRRPDCDAMISDAVLTYCPLDPARAAFRRAGSFRLKGFDEPEPIWAEASTGDPDAAPHPAGR